MGSDARDEYWLGRSDAETNRLALQDHLVRGLTIQLFERAGIVPGIRVLDVGSGAGDVAIAVGGLVGPTGSVVGVEVDSPSVETARRKAAAAGLAHVRFVVDDIRTVSFDEPFDAAVGRLVLIHLPDVVATLTRLRGLLRPGGLVVFQEPHAILPWVSVPASPSLAEMDGVRRSALATGRAVHPDLGLGLRAAFLQAGFQHPDMVVDGMVGGGAGWPGFRYLEETARSLLPSWRRVGAAGAGALVVDGLAERIEREVGDDGAVLIHVFIGAWATNPR